MGVKRTYTTYKLNEDGPEYFPIGTVAKMVGKSSQMIRLWDIWSDELALSGSKRLIPKSTRIGKNQMRCWTMEEINQIISFSKNVKYGDIAQFSRTRWGTRAEEMQQDRSTVAREAKKKERAQINKNSVKIQKQRKAEEIKRARGSMLKAVRRKARILYDSINYDV